MLHSFLHYNYKYFDEHQAKERHCPFYHPMFNKSNIFYVHYYLLNENLVSVSAIMRHPLAFIYEKIYKYEKII